MSIISDYVERMEKNIAGYSKGYGGCRHCYDTWDWKAPHYITIPGFLRRWRKVGAFPYCKECHARLGALRKIWLMLGLGIEWVIEEDRGFRWKLWEAIETVLFCLCIGLDG